MAADSKTSIHVQRPHRGSRARSLALLAIISVALYLSNYRIAVVSRTLAPTPKQMAKKCSPPLPKLLASTPPTADNPHIKKASASLHAFLNARTKAKDIDSISIGIVTPAGFAFTAGYGVARANESIPEKQGVVDSNTIYRIASITKMFTVLETLILRERGHLNWDDPVTKFLPNFTNPSSGWVEHLSGTGIVADKSPVTLRQLASHLSGIGRDYPPYDVGEWPANLPVGVSAARKSDDPLNGNLEHLMRAVANIPLVTPQYTFPVYSNTGFDLLGVCNVLAHKIATGEAKSHRQLLEKDVFIPLGMNSSFYQIPNTRLSAHMAVPAMNSTWADLTFSPTYDPAGGQYSSLADLATFMRTLLAPQAGGVLSPYVVREWLRPLHAWNDGLQEVGAPWEIEKIGNEDRAYSKAGNLPGYHSQFTVIPQWSYGVIVLVTGTYTDTLTLAHEALARFHPAFEQVLRDQVRSTYSGIWIGDNSVAVVTLEEDGLYLQTLVVKGYDVISLLQRNPPKGSQPVPLWSTGRPHEFRLGIGRRELNDKPEAGCEPYWLSFDFPTALGAPLDLIFWDGVELVYPSAGVKLRRGHT